ncbi:phospholipase A2 inhibitor-like isoform X2 [Mercenaria mercenaria]|uniref:phospholipase A2 inhibitor-like isoform X2 n=1 Tax=Mercenaria mercenaria TaxID=6596 RepID=UPI00234EF527|nr:phospholipase A2 inhibitor-like isoform X2 [Mercenaria mercenaria]
MASSSSSSTIVLIILSVSSFVSIETTESIYGKCDNPDHTFNCSGVGLLEIPGGEHIPSYMETLDLSNNHISNISFLNYPTLSSSLSKLNLSNNQIYIVKKDAFKLLTNLVTLDLSNNLIFGPDLDESMFYDLKKLQYLILEKNPIRHIKKDTFTFMELPAVRYFDLSHCEISELEAGSLDLPSLEHLDLSWNKLQNFKSDSFRMLVNLQTLDMSHNRITVLEQVPHMPELIIWILDNNGMERIAIRDDLIDFTDSLQKLYLRNNDIKRFDAESLPLDDLDSLQVIDMSNNKLKCDCKMRWIRSDDYDLKGKNYTFMCESPSNVRNNNLLEMAPEDLKCGTSLAKILFIVVVSTVGALALMLIIFFVIRRRRRRKLKRKAARGDSGGLCLTTDERARLDVYIVPT